MAFTDVFGGELLFPSQLSYLEITTAVDIELQWPTEQQITGNNVVADFLDIDATVGGLTIDMPDARNTSTGNKTTFNNISLNGFTVRDNTGGVIQFVGDGEQWVIVLTDNSTQAGLWSAFQLGAATTIASASALAGAGLQANVGGMLERIIDSDEEVSTPITVVDGDRAKCLIYTGGAGQADLPSAGTVGSNWFFMLRNSGSGTLTVVPAAGEIDGSPNLALDTNSSAIIFTDGTDWFTIGLTASSTIAFDFVSLPIPGSGDFVLSGANLDRISYRFTGALTGNRKVVVPDTTQQYWCDNQTSGAFVLTIGTNAQVSPPTLDAGQTAILYSNSIEVIDAVNAVSVMFPIQISQGGTGATNAADARTNLDVPQTGDVVPITRLINSGDALNGGGDLSADLTLDVQVGLGLVIPGGVEIQLDVTDSHNLNHDNIDILAGTGISAAGLGNISADRTINANLATETLEGVLEVATQIEADAGLLDNKIITPLKLANFPGMGSVVVTTGTFVPGWTGFSANPTATMRFTKFDPITPGADTLVILRHDAGNPTGTSNATGFSMTGLPATIVPSTFGAGAQCHALFTDNTVFNHVGAAQVNITAVMSFYIESVSGSRVLNSLTGWTAAGLKGWSNNSYFIYGFEP